MGQRDGTIHARGLRVIFGERTHRYSDEGAVATRLGSSDTPDFRADKPRPDAVKSVIDAEVEIGSDRWRRRIGPRQRPDLERVPQQRSAGKSRRQPAIGEDFLQTSASQVGQTVQPNGGLHFSCDLELHLTKQVVRQFGAELGRQRGHGTIVIRG